MDQLQRLDAANTRWNDYVGTAAADDRDGLTGQRSLYDLAGLDRGRWTVAAVDLTISDGNPAITVYAVDRGDASDFDLDTVIAEHGHLPVTAYPLTDPGRVEDFLREAFRRVSVRMVARGFRDEQLVVSPTPDPS